MMIKRTILLTDHENAHRYAKISPRLTFFSTLQLYICTLPLQLIRFSINLFLWNEKLHCNFWYLPMSFFLLNHFFFCETTFMLHDKKLTFRWHDFPKNMDKFKFWSFLENYDTSKINSGRFSCSASSRQTRIVSVSRLIRFVEIFLKMKQKNVLCLLFIHVINIIYMICWM